MTMLVLDKVKFKTESIKTAQEELFYISYNSHEAIFAGKEDIKIDIASTEEAEVHIETIDLGGFIILL